MCEELSYQIINTSAVNQAIFLLLLEVCKNISVGGREQSREAFFQFI